MYGHPIGDITIGSIRLGDWLVRMEVWIALIVLLLVLIIVSAVHKKKKKRAERQQTSETSDSQKHEYQQGRVLYDVGAPSPGAVDKSEKTIDIYGGGEVTINPYAGGEETINPYGSEETVAPYWEAPTVIRFLVNTRDEQFEQEISFTDSMKIGRNEGCQLCLKPKYISRQHIEITKLPDGVFVRNLVAEKSESFTRLNHTSLGEELQPVHDGDRLEIAQTSIEIRLVEKK